MGQEEYVFDDNKKGNAEGGGILSFIWNSNTKEFCGRDGASWAKVSLFYAVFYAFLGSFFVGMLAVFVQIMPRDKPMYYGLSSTMNARKLNPGLGFRPQINVEDHLIAYNPNIVEGEFGYMKYQNNLQNYLDAKYPPIPSDAEGDVINCEKNSDHTEELANGKACAFDYKEIFKGTDCTEEDNYGFTTSRPCILIKVNKIVDWTPVSEKGGIEIRCQGETSVDRDNIKNVVYHSESALHSSNYTVIDAKFYPYFNQKAYRAPFIWAKFDLTADTLVNIVCKAYADNIDNDDRLNRRGQTKFSLYISSKQD